MQNLNKYDYIIDADGLVYKIAYFNENEIDEKEVRRNTIKYIEKNIFNKYNKVLFVLQGKGNFRKNITEEYKANRKDKKQYKWLQTVRKTIEDNYNTLIINGYETDDVCASILKQNNNKILIHTDKDLLQIPGIHIYRDKQIIVDETEAYKYFMYQFIIGDTTDNIKGIPGRGKVFANKLLKQNNLLDILEEIIKEYVKTYKDETEGLKKFYENFKLLKLKTNVLNDDK